MREARAAASHLVKLGHRRIAYIGDQFGYQSDAERLSGYREALEAAKIRFVPQLVAYGDGKPEAAMRAMDTLLRSQHPPDSRLLL